LTARFENVIYLTPRHISQQRLRQNTIQGVLFI